MQVLGLLEDDHLLRTALTDALSARGFKIAVSSPTVDDFLRKTGRAHIDCAILDLHLGSGATGADVAKHLSMVYPNTGIVILTSFQDPRLIGVTIESLPPGSVYLEKILVHNIESLVVAIQEATQKATRKITFAKHAEVENLKTSQLEILRLVARGLSNLEIAKMRNVSEKAIEAALTKMIKNLDVKTGPSQNQRVHLARIYFASRGLPIED